MIIKGKDIYGLVLSGAKNIVVNELGLNKINVFPVPDGDTGTNLSLTMNQIILETVKYDELSKQIENIAEIALNNAYGNSGMIFAEYLSGMAEFFKEKKDGVLSDFKTSFSYAYSKAYKSVAQPKDGTVLSVMKTWTNLLNESMHTEIDLLFTHNLNHLKSAVENTKQQMKILKENDVVDAGAMAFFYFIEGMVYYLKHKTYDDLTFTASTLELISEPLKSLDIGEHRYCCQFQVQAQIDKKELSSQLEKYGDSLVINQTEEHINIHLHSNVPDKIMADLVKIGLVSNHKVDDMLLQTKMIHSPKSKIAILTDSIADLPQAFIDENQIYVLPLNIIVDSVVYKDKLTMKADNFYQYLDDYRLNPTSSQPNTKTVERYLKQVLDHYDEVIGIFVSSKMSGTFNNVNKILNKFDLSNKKIRIIDSKRNSVTQGLLVYEAINARDKGLNFEELVQHIEKSIERSEIFVSVKDLKYMIKGGRVSKISGAFLAFIKLKPVISIDQNGQGIIPFKTLSQKSAVRSIIKKIKRDLKNDKIKNYSLVYADNATDLKQLKEESLKIIGKEPVFISNISPIVGLNAGKGAFAIGYIKEDRTYD